MLLAHDFFCSLFLACKIRMSSADLGGGGGGLAASPAASSLSPFPSGWSYALCTSALAFSSSVGGSKGLSQSGIGSSSSSSFVSPNSLAAGLAVGLGAE